MLAIIHALVGSLIGEEFHSIFLISVLSLALHFIFDMVPHWDVDWDKKKFLTTGEAVVSNFAKVWFIIDHILAISLAIYLFYTFDSKRMALGAFMSVLPDWIGLGYKTPLRKNKRFMNFLKFHSRIQNHTNFKRSMITQGIIFSLLAFLFYLVYNL